MVDVLGEGPVPVMVLHGFTGSAQAMEPLTHRLAGRRFTVAAPDLVGHGRSDAPEDLSRYTVSAMAGHICQIGADLAWRTFHLVGYSMGARVALTAAVANPGVLRSLTLIGATPGIADPAERKRRRGADEALAQQVTNDFEGFVDGWMANPLFAGQAALGNDHQQQARAQRLANNPQGLACSLRAAGTGSMTPLHDRLEVIDRPVLVVVGEQDPKFRRIAVELEAGLRNATVTTIEGAGHAAHVERPHHTAQAIAAFVNRCEAELPMATRGNQPSDATVLISPGSHDFRGV